jgi:2-polyprenyl-6-methoxyphenol hydroxylase-like FAD-dependent oxidoreductase
VSVQIADVVVSGAGPVGLFLACELQRNGRTCIVLERNAGPSTHSKALAIMPKTLHLFEAAGIAGDFLTAVNRVSSLRFDTPRRSVRVSFADVRTPFPFVSILPQWKTEALLAARLRALGGEVRYGNALEALEARDGGVVARVASSRGAYNVHASYAAGCDGVRSTVRECTGIPFEGISYRQQALLADVRASAGVPPDEAFVHVDRHGMLTLFPISAELRRIVIVAPQETLAGDPSIAWLQSHLDRCALSGTRIDEITWASTFRVHRRIAARMRAGRILLAGDAAHAHSPVGGQGMNTGLHDAFSLALALCAALDGNENALDGYARERLAAAREVVRRTDFLTRALAHPHPALCVGREFLAPYVIGMPVLRDRMVRALLTA